MARWSRVGFIRRFIPPLGAIDLSPMVAIIVLYFVRSLLVSVIQG